MGGFHSVLMNGTAILNSELLLSKIEFRPQGAFQDIVVPKRGEFDFRVTMEWTSNDIWVKKIMPNAAYLEIPTLNICTDRNANKCTFLGKFQKTEQYLQYFKGNPAKFDGLCYYFFAIFF